MSDQSSARGGVRVEPLEPRLLLSSAFPNVNISRLGGSQAEGAIAIDRTDFGRLFATSNVDVGDGLLAASSTDAGATWSRRVIADGSRGSDLDPACCDPSAAFDAFGNLFLTYLNGARDHIRVLLSTDGGASFSAIAGFEGEVDQPTITTGPGSVWVTFARAGKIVAAGAAVNGRGAVGDFGPAQTAPSSKNGNFGDIAINSNGQVMVAYQRGSGERSKLYVSVDSDGLGPERFGAHILAASTNVGDFLKVPSQPVRGVDAEASLAFDRSGGPFAGRVYLVYTDRLGKSGDNTDTFLRYSDDTGAHWSNPIRVNNDTGQNSQILPRVAVDDTSGNFAVGWYDSRNDRGDGNADGDTDGIPNDDVQYFAAVGTPITEGVRLSANLQISQGASTAASSRNAIDLGDYTGIDYFNGAVHPVWADNSNSTGDDPEPPLGPLDLYTARADAAAFGTPSSTALGGLVTGAGPTALFAGKLSARARKAYKFKVIYSAAAGLDEVTINGDEIQFVGPDGVVRTAVLHKVKKAKGGGFTATYRVFTKGEALPPSVAGTYKILLVAGSLSDASGNPVAGGIIANLLLT